MSSDATILTQTSYVTVHITHSVYDETAASVIMNPISFLIFVPRFSLSFFSFFGFYQTTQIESIQLPYSLGS